MEKTKQKRVLCVLSTMNIGGAETFLMKVFRSLDKTLFCMDFCVDVDDKCFYEDEIASMGGQTFHIPSRSKNCKLHERELARIVKSGSYANVLFVSSSPFCYLDCRTAKKAGAGLVLLRSTNAPLLVPLFKRFVLWLFRGIFSKYVDIRISPSDLAADYLFGKSKASEVVYLKNGVDLERYSFRQDVRDELRKSLGVNRAAYVIGHVGRFNPQKNHPFIIDVFGRFSSSHPDAVLLLIGDGYQKEAIAKMVVDKNLSDKVVFVDATRDVNRYYSVMDVFMLPSFHEGMPNVAIEAQANGLRCLFSAGITKEADITGENCFLDLKSADEWVLQLERNMSKSRGDFSAILKEKGYDISSVAAMFASLLK